jgi:hypothetical protein
MSVTKKTTSRKRSAPLKRNAKVSGVTIVYKSKTSKPSFPAKTAKANKLLSKAQLLK